MAAEERANRSEEMTRRKIAIRMCDAVVGVIVPQPFANATEVMAS
jgi:hypothetical protein